MHVARLIVPRFLAALLGGCGIASAGAAGKVSISVGSAEFAGLSIEDAGLDWTPQGGASGRTQIRAARVRGVPGTGPLSGFTIDCPDLRISGNELHCPRGRLKGTLGSLGGQDTRFSARLSESGAITVELDTFSLAGGQSKLGFTLDGARWRLEAAFDELALDAALGVATPWFALPDGFTVAGNSSGEVHAAGRSNTLGNANAEIRFTGLAFSDAQGTLAGEALSGTLQAKLLADREDFAVSAGRLELSGGQAYSDPVFLDFGLHRLDLDFAGRLEGSGPKFEVAEFKAVHHDVVTAAGSATLDFQGETLLTDARMRIDRFALDAAAPVYFQPFLIDTALKDLQGAGTAKGEIDIAGGLPTRAAIVLEDVALLSPSGAISIHGLHGDIRWFDDAARTQLAGTIDDAEFRSSLSWDAARLWGIEIGQVELPFATTGRHFRLLEPKILPIFDGGLAIGTLRVRHAGTEQMYVRFDAELQPVSVARLSRALGWPEFQGTLAGSIPDLQFAAGVATLGGNLEARVFDGRIVVRELQLRDPLGKYPRLHASIDLDNLDLALLTNTFSFGMITGRLSGRMENLETFDWMPVAFDAQFGTPPGDRSKRRISQRAVTNLSSIGGGSGGGVAAALQGGLLRFFDDFRYDRLGLTCRLANDVCQMGGVEPAPGGYYIVKGAGLPRIDVIGSQTRVAWTRLVRQLALITESDIVVE
ncbi:MAG: hypothetical protein M3O07_04240 [Pseudomonadota bacterium]|nr:hypothetical protein [Pseudomonadota bacterium]